MSSSRPVGTEGVWRIDLDSRRPGTWWWWFWLFFFDNPKDPQKPRQLMILWSTKDDRRIQCNSLDIVLPEDPIKIEGKRATLDGAVAAWYFDGEKMHDDFVLERCDVVLDEAGKTLKSVPHERTGNETGFYEKNGKFVTRIKTADGQEFEFESSLLKGNEMGVPVQSTRQYLGGKFDYKILRIQRMDLKARVKAGKRAETAAGTAYFQKVMVNAPVAPWFWGILHFGDGSALQYFNPHVGMAALENNPFSGMVRLDRARKSLTKDITFYDASGKQTTHFKDVKIRAERRGGLPAWRISGKNGGAEIEFVVDAYAHSCWTFRKKIGGVLPVRSRLDYNEYPCRCSFFELRKNGKKKTLADIGGGVGNAEYAWGFLI